MKRHLLLLWHLACIALALGVFGTMVLVARVLIALTSGILEQLQNGAAMWQTAWTIFKKGNAE